MKKISFVSVAVVIVFLILLLWPVADYVYTTEYKETTMVKITNEENGYTVTFNEVGEAFLFGNSKVKVILEDENGEKIAEIKDTISNDGKRLGEENISVVWCEDEVRVTLHGEEQKDELHVIEY